MTFYECVPSAFALNDFSVVEAADEPSVEEGFEAGGEVILPAADQVEAVCDAVHLRREGVVIPGADGCF